MASAAPTRAAPAAGAAPAADATRIRVRLEQDGTAFAARAQTDADVLLTLSAPAYEPDEAAERPAVDLMLVVDTSGSMGGAKLDLVRRTIEFVVSQLRPRDRLALVTFGSEVHLEHGFLAMDKAGRAQATARARALRAGSCTNLSGGLLQGLQLLRERRTQAPVSSVFLLTDGLANRGITSSQGIVDAAASVITEGVQVYSFGYGSYHSSEMLTALAGITPGGMYTFVETDEAVPGAFGEALGGLLSVVAQNLTVTLTPVNDATSATPMTNYRVAAGAGDAKVIHFGDLQSEEERDVVVRLRLRALAAPRPDAMDAVAVRVSYFNVITGAMDTVVRVCGVTRPAETPARGPVSTRFLQQRCRRVVTDALEGARRDGDARKFDAARAKVDAAIARLVPLAADATVDEMLGDLRECRDGLRSQDAFLKVGQHQMRSHGASHAYQRSNCAAAEGLSAGRVRKAYANKANFRFKAAAFKSARK